MDRADASILKQLQNNCTMSHAEIGEIANLSASQVSRRIQRLQQDGVVRRQVALLDEAALGLQVEAFVAVALSSYAPEVVRRFHERICGLEDVLDCSATTGDADYLLRIVSRDLRAFSRLMNREILGHGDVSKVQSSVVLDRVKRTTELPLPVP